MDVRALIGRVEETDAAVADRATLQARLADLGKLSAWIEAHRTGFIARLSDLRDCISPEDDVAHAQRTSTHDARVAKRRADTLQQLSGFGEALGNGEISPAHIDEIANGLAKLPTAQRPTLAAKAAELLATARTATPHLFRKTINTEVRKLLTEADASERLQRQQRACRLRTWTDDTTQLWHVHGCFDPETGRKLANRLTNALAALFPDSNNLPGTCPDEPGERGDHLQALTLVELLVGHQAPGWNPEALLVVDERTCRRGYHDASIVDIGADADLPIEAVHRLVHCSTVIPVVMSDGVVVEVLDGHNQLNLGRASRLAGRSQRRALRTMYPTCAITGCEVRFSNCRIHHVDWWEHGGFTDLCNLVPLCSRHHHAVHDLGWQLHLDAARNLTVATPGGTVMTTGPPYAFADVSGGSARADAPADLEDLLLGVVDVAAVRIDEL